jgi:D-lactate dehydrogenase
MGGIGLDVYEDESSLAVDLRNLNANSRTVGEIHALASFPNIILTPHNAFNTIDALKRKSQMTVEQVKHFLLHKDFIWKLK